MTCWERWREWWAGCRMCGYLRGMRRNGMCDACQIEIARWHDENMETVTQPL